MKLPVRKILILLLAAVLVLAGTAALLAAFGQPEPKSPPAPAASHDGPVQDYISFVDHLRATGLSVEPTGEVSTEFFSVKAFVLTVNTTATIQVFEYATERKADTEAARVASDGGEIRTGGFSPGATKVDWIDPPHFFKKERIIVLYVGSDPQILSVLTTVLGTQFAGR